MKITRHVSVSIELLLSMNNDRLEAMFEMPGAEARSDLEERKANGEIKIGSEHCEGFSPITGCPGHPQE